MYKIYNVILDSSSCAFYRQVLPTIHCRDVLKAHDIELSMGTRISPDHDAYVFSRVPDPRLTMAILKLVDRGKRIIWDIDDDLVNIPDWNTNKKLFDANMISFLEVYFALSERVVVSTDYLKASLSVSFPKILDNKAVVLENLVDPSFYLPIGNYSTRSYPIRIAWAGSPTHSGDLECLEPLVYNYRDNNNVCFIFYGYLPRQYAAMPNSRAIHIPWGPKKHYEATISIIRPDIGLIPLANVHFNKSKSAIKFYEMTMAGAACVLTDINPYSTIVEHGRTGFLVSDHGGWMDYCKNLISDHELRWVMAETARERVISEYSWETKNPRREAWVEFYRSLAG